MIQINEFDSQTMYYRGIMNINRNFWAEFFCLQQGNVNDFNANMMIFSALHGR